MTLIGLGQTEPAAAASLNRTEVIARAGPWQAFGGYSVDGHEVCGVLTSGTDGQFFSVKRYGTDRILIIQLRKSTWNFDPHSNVTVRMQMDDNSPWKADADATGHMIEFNIPYNSIGQFADEFRNSFELDLLLGGKVTWTIDLHGTQEVLAAFVKCLNVMDEQ